MSRKRTTWIAGNTIEVYDRTVYRAEIVNGKPIRAKRGKREKKTSDAVQKYNAILRERKLIRKVNHNFRKGDLYLTLTYPRDTRPAPEQAARDVHNYIDAIRRRYKKAGSELKYIVTTEVGSRGGIHHHILLNRSEGIDTAVLADIWERYGGHLHFQHLRGNDFSKLALYFLKGRSPASIIKPGANRMPYGCSRNMPDPPEQHRTIKRDSWRKQPAPVKGYRVDSIVIGVNPVTQQGYRFYRMVKIE